MQYIDHNQRLIKYPQMFVDMNRMLLMVVIHWALGETFPNTDERHNHLPEVY